MIPSTQHLHNLIRSGQADCYCPEETKVAREVTHLPGCRWAAAVDEIYRLERADEAKTAASPSAGIPSGE